MTEKHTPGPWHRNIHPRYPIYSEQRNQKVAAALYGGRTGVSEAEALANCDLIAAAPELLAALRFAEPYIDEWVDMFDPSDEVDADIREAREKCRRGLAQVRAAIAKAEGR